MSRVDPLKPDEIQILKAVNMMLDDEKCLLVTYQYHTELDPKTSKVDHEKSFYRYLARVSTIAKLKEEASDLFTDEKRLLEWHWPSDPLPGYKMWSEGSTNYRGSRWLTCRVNKVVDWEKGQEILKGWSKRKDTYSPKDKYETEGYTSEDGTTVSLTDKDTLMKLVGQTLHRPLLLVGKRGREQRAQLKKAKDLENTGASAPSQA